MNVERRGRGIFDIRQAGFGIRINVVRFDIVPISSSPPSRKPPEDPEHLAHLRCSDADPGGSAIAPLVVMVGRQVLSELPVSQGNHSSDFMSRLICAAAVAASRPRDRFADRCSSFALFAVVIPVLVVILVLVVLPPFEITVG